MSIVLFVVALGFVYYCLIVVLVSCIIRFLVVDVRVFLLSWFMFLFVVLLSFGIPLLLCVSFGVLVLLYYCFLVVWFYCRVRLLSLGVRVLLYYCVMFLGLFMYLLK